ncbi:EF-hand domain-containing protein, partial [Thiocystis violacea]|uniref:EF-hand domain-containing protein n=1 Tax=Thiocystis violacea TaxID=13725 RepID=UPI0019064654
MKATTLTLMIAAILATVGASPAFAQATNAPARGPMTFADFDPDGDGRVSEQEFNNARAQRLAAQAATGAPMRGAASAPSFADFDLNGDGQMTADEFANVHDSRMRGRPGMGMG